MYANVRWAVGSLGIVILTYFSGCNGQSPETRLVSAVRGNDNPALQRLLERYPSAVNTTTNGDDTLLHEAARLGQLDVIHTLLANGAAIDATNSSGETALYCAVQHNHADAVEALLEAGATPDIESDVLNETPFTLATRRGFIDVMNLLIDYGVDVNQQRVKNGRTPLHEAVFWRQPESVDLLIASGADVSITDNIGRTPLHIAVEMDRFSETLNEEPVDVRIVKSLLRAGASPDAMSINKSTPVSLATKFELQQISKLLSESVAHQDQ